MGMNIEPHGDIRQGAATFYQFFVAYVQAGFTEDQAMELVKTILQTQVITSITNDDKDGDS